MVQISAGNLKMSQFLKLQLLHRAVVVAQLGERLLLTPEIRGLIPNIGQNLSVNCIT